MRRDERREVPSMCWAVPVLANGKIYARNSTYTRSNPGKLVCVELKTTAPRVDAGSSCVTWLEDGATTVDLGGSVEDERSQASCLQRSQDPGYERRWVRAAVRVFSADNVLRDGHLTGTELRDYASEFFRPFICGALQAFRPIGQIHAANELMLHPALPGLVNSLKNDTSKICKLNKKSKRH